MGAEASHLSINMPSSYTQVKTETTTKLFTVPGYSKWTQMQIGSALKYNKFSLCHCTYRLKVYTAGFDEESAGYVAIFVAFDRFDSRLRFNPAVKVFIEILDVGGERAVFDNHTAMSKQTLVDKGGSKGYIRFVRWTDLEAASCVCADDTITVRCTLSLDVKETKKIKYLSKRAAPLRRRTRRRKLLLQEHNDI